VSSSFRENCGSFIQIRASKDGQSLVVVKMEASHNHPINKVSTALNSKLNLINGCTCHRNTPPPHPTKNMGIGGKVGDNGALDILLCPMGWRLRQFSSTSSIGIMLFLQHICEQAIQ
jgi:hypothetical protein